MFFLTKLHYFSCFYSWISHHRNLKLYNPVFLEPETSTRRFSNHESCLLSRSHTFAIIVILDLTPYLLRWYVQICSRIIMSKSHENTSKYVDIVIFFQKLEQKRSLTPGWPLTPSLLRSHVWLYPKIIVSKSHENISKYVDTVTFFQKLEPKVNDP